MNALRQFQENIFALPTNDFEEHALALFRWQAEHNEVYHAYIRQLGIDPEAIGAVEQIPFLPIDFFKRHRILSTPVESVEVVFESSGTTAQVRSQHHVTDLSFYHRVSQHIFEAQFGPLSSYHVVALLPSYLERSNASLVSMVDHFVRQSASPYSGFYLDDYEALLHTIASAQQREGQVLLVGVTFALLRLAEAYAPDLSNIVILETGGMKGMRKEMIREEVYYILQKNTGVQQIHSEYGMTELLSQAYSQQPGTFHPPPWVRVMIREINDPFVETRQGQMGGINVIDLANVHSCAFIETMDRGRMCQGQAFEVLGRLDNSDLRGCNTMLTV